MKVLKKIRLVNTLLKQQLMITKGTVVEIRKSNKSFIGLCVGQSKSKLRILLAGNKETQLPLEKALFPSEYTIDTDLPREELVDKLKNIHEEREKLKETIPLEELWQLLVEEEEAYSPEEIGELYFESDMSSDQLSSVYRALSDDSIYFKSKKSQFYPNSPENVEKIQKMLEGEKAKNLRNTKITTWISHIWNSTEPDESDSDIDGFIDKLKYVCVNKIESKTHKSVNALLKEANVSGKNIPFRLLVKAGIWDEDENLNLYEYDVPVKFEQKVLSETKKIISKAGFDTCGKEDLTHLHTFTIDSEDTRDMDDALSIVKNDRGYEVGIHITDVAEFILDDSKLDLEAKARFTSIYMPDKKINMIPESLSTELFSLIKGEVRPVISVIIFFDNDFNMIDYDIKEAIIKVKERLTYEEADKLIEVSEDYSIIYQISKKLKERRRENGAVFFYIPELEIKVDDDRKVEVTVYERETPSHLLVSEMMILANELCATYCKKYSIPIIYRSQPEISEEFTVSEDYDPVAFFNQRKLLKKSESSIYPHKHYGLGVALYSQMTSPIRRYIDLLIQRQLKNFLRSGKYLYESEELEEFIMTSDEILDIANLITRRRKRYWLLKYLKDKIGEIIEAIVLQDMGEKMVIILKEYLIELTCHPLRPFAPGENINVRIETVSPREDLIRVSVVEHL